MIKNIYKTLAIVAVIAVFTSSCRSTEEYKKFAEAGNKFAEATNSLLDNAREVTINITSERVLSDRSISRIAGLNFQNDRDKKIINDFVERYNQLSQKDKERLDLINGIREHNQLLQAYFSKLIELANSDAPERTKSSVESIANQLQATGSKVIKLSPIKIDKLPSVTKIVLDARIRGALRKELEKRKDIIYKEITIQEQLLNFLANSIEEDIKIMRDLQENRLVLTPLIQQQEINQAEWIKKREEVLTQDVEVILAIKKASNALGEFKGLFQTSIEGGLTSERLNQFFQNTDSFVTTVSRKK